MLTQRAINTVQFQAARKLSTEVTELSLINFKDNNV